MYWPPLAIKRFIQLERLTASIVQFKNTKTTQFGLTGHCEVFLNVPPLDPVLRTTPSGVAITWTACMNTCKAVRRNWTSWGRSKTRSRRRTGVTAWWTRPTPGDSMRSGDAPASPPPRHCTPLKWGWLGRVQLPPIPQISAYNLPSKSLCDFLCSVLITFRI